LEAKINLITIWTDDIKTMRDFYNKVLGFEIQNNLGSYVEFKNSGVRFAICQRDVMYNFSGEYKKPKNGQAFELAFPCSDPEDVDRSFLDLVSKGAEPIHAPADMPWKQRTALFADPDGNIHEIFAELKNEISSEDL